MTFKKNYGYTLIQVLAVLVIIGILSSIAYATFNTIFNKSELSAGYSQADKIEEAMAIYIADNNGKLPTEIENADYISKPAKIDLSKIGNNLKGKPKGTFYIYGGEKEVSFDYPSSYIQKVYDNYPNKVEIIIAKESRIDTDLLHSKGILDYKAFTNYILMGDGTIIQTYDRGKVNNYSDGKPSKPVIIPSKLAPYYNTDSISFTATSYSSKGTVKFEWENAVEKVGKNYPIGKNTVKVTAVDKDGIRSETSIFEFDVVSASTINQPPSIPVITANPSKATYVSSETISLSALSTDPEGDPLSYIWIGKSNNDYYGRGIHEVSVYAMDSKGNVSPKAKTTLTVKNGSPIITDVTYSPNPAYLFDNLKFTVKAKDNDGDMIRYEWRMDKNKDGTVEVYDSLNGKYPIGNYNAEVRAIDSLNDASPWYGFTFKITNRNPTKPTFSMSPSPISKIYGNTPISFTYCCSTDPDEDDKNLTYETVNFKTSYPFVSGTTNDTQTITAKVRAKDSHGGYSEYAEITFTVLNTPPTKPSISMTPSSTSDLRSNTNITFTASGSTELVDKDSFIYEYQVDGGSWSTTVPKTFSVGTHTVKVRAKDIRGGYSEENSISFTINNTPPTQPTVRPISSIGSYGKTSNIGFQLGSSSTDVDNDAISYEYNANSNGWSSTAPNQQFIYSPQHTTNTVSVRAKDVRGGYSSTYSYQFAYRDSYYTTEVDVPSYTITVVDKPGYWTTYSVQEVYWCYGREPGTVGPMYSHAPPCDYPENELKQTVTYDRYVDPTYKTETVPTTYKSVYHSGYWYAK